MKSSNQKSEIISSRRVRPLLGTFVEIELRGNTNQQTLDDIITEGFNAVAEIDRLMSFHRAESDLSLINRSQPRSWIDINPHTARVLKMASDLFTCSNGIFDIRCGS